MIVPDPQTARMAKAELRARKLDVPLETLRRQVADKPPAELNDIQTVAERENFLRSSLQDPAIAALTLERVLNGNELQPANYLARGALAARAVARIDIRDGNGGRVGWGTGFLIAPGVLITNNHVLGDATVAGASFAQFGYELDLKDQLQQPAVFMLEPKRLFYTSLTLDFTIVAVAPRDTDGISNLSGFGYLPLLALTGKVLDGECG